MRILIVEDDFASRKCMLNFMSAWKRLKRI